jgi:hypothetical protein
MVVLNSDASLLGQQVSHQTAQFFYLSLVRNYTTDPVPYIIVQRVQGVEIRKKWYKNISEVRNKNRLYTYFEEHI